VVVPVDPFQASLAWRTHLRTVSAHPTPSLAATEVIAAQVQWHWKCIRREEVLDQRYPLARSQRISLAGDAQ
jgi:hypothetical protein